MLPSLKYLDDADADGNEVDESDAEDGQNGTLDEEGSDEDGKLSFFYSYRQYTCEPRCLPKIVTRKTAFFLRRRGHWQGWLEPGFHKPIVQSFK